jgi:hypothetical protein
MLKVEKTFVLTEQGTPMLRRKLKLPESLNASFRLPVNTSKVASLALAFVLVTGLAIYFLTSSHVSFLTTSPGAGSANASGGSAGPFGGTSRSGGSTSWSCVSPNLPNKGGACPLNDGGFTNHPTVTGVGDTNPNILHDVWSGDSHYQATLYANSPGDWKVVVNITEDAGGGVLAYPNVGWYPYPNLPEVPVDSYSSITSSWNVTIPADSRTTTGWAAYDLWLNGGWENKPDEVMIQPDITANQNYDCKPVATATFGGMPWHLCVFGSERVWKPGTDDQHLINQPSGTVNVLAIIKWMEHNGYLPRNSTWFAESFGFEICNTSGTVQTFQVNDFTWHQR